MTDKKALRTQLRQRRQQLTPQQQRQASTALYRQLKHQWVFLRAKHIAFYLPNDGEIDPRPLLKAALQQGKRCYLPVINRHTSLVFLPFHKHSRLKPNRFGILEPIAKLNEAIKPKQLDVVLMPLVGFDKKGTRMGMGGGFYDRTFAFRQQISQQRPRLIGLAHECQYTAELNSSSWDIPMDFIVTDKQVIRC